MRVLFAALLVLAFIPAVHAQQFKRYALVTLMTGHEVPMDAHAFQGMCLPDLSIVAFAAQIGVPWEELKPCESILNVLAVVGTRESCEYLLHQYPASTVKTACIAQTVGDSD